MHKILNTLEITIIDGIKRKSTILKSDKLGFQRKKTCGQNDFPFPARNDPPVPGNDPLCQEMTTCDRKRPTHDRK